MPFAQLDRDVQDRRSGEGADSGDKIIGESEGVGKWRRLRSSETTSMKPGRGYEIRGLRGPGGVDGVTALALPRPQRSQALAGSPGADTPLKPTQDDASGLGELLTRVLPRDVLDQSR